MPPSNGSPGSGPDSAPGRVREDGGSWGRAKEKVRGLVRSPCAGPRVCVVGIGAQKAYEAKAVVGYTGVQDLRPPCSWSFSPVENFDYVGVADFVLVAGSTGAMEVDTIGRQVDLPLPIARVGTTPLHPDIMTASLVVKDRGLTASRRDNS